MTKPLPISCFIVTYNEADRIERALVSVRKLVDEIVVVDSGSTDETVKISASYGAKVFYRQWDNYGLQKRFAEDQCNNDWLLNIDADEWLDSELVESVRRLCAHGDPDKPVMPVMPVWCLRRRNIYFGDRAPRWHVRGELLVRLYDRRQARFSTQPMRATVPHCKGRTGTLRGTLLHCHARSVKHLVEKELNAESLNSMAQRKSWPVLLAALFFGFPKDFFGRYLFNHHFLGGKKGFACSMIYAYARFLNTASEVEHRLRWREKEARRPTPPPLSQEARKQLPQLPLYGYILAHNEADRIGRALASLQLLVRETVVIDGGSNDGTQAVAQSYGARVVHNDWEGFEKQRLFAVSQLPKGWVIWLDADEWLSPELIASIRTLFKEGEPKLPAYDFYRNDLFVGKIKDRTCMKRQAYTRLCDSRHYDNAKIDYDVRQYDIAQIDGNQQLADRFLKGRMFHMAVRSMQQLTHKEIMYSGRDQIRVSKPSLALSLRLFVEMPLFFIKWYIFRGAIFGGLQGYCYSVIYSYARFQRILKLAEAKPEWRT